jgi:hypothetical protein
LKHEILVHRGVRDVATKPSDSCIGTREAGEKSGNVGGPDVVGALIAPVGTCVGVAGRKIVLARVRGCEGRSEATVLRILSSAQNRVCDDLLIQGQRALDLPSLAAEAGLVLRAKSRVVAQVGAPVPHELAVVDVEERKVLGLVAPVGDDPNRDADDGARAYRRHAQGQ